MNDLIVIASCLEDAAKKLRSMEMNSNPDELEPGRVLARARNRANLSQAELGRLSGVSTNAIINFEGGKTRPRERTLMALAEEAGIPWKWLLPSDEEPDGGADDRPRDL